MAALSDVAEAHEWVAEAARYVRASEFFPVPGDPRKPAAYERFIALFDQAHPGLERHEVPSPNGPLPVLRLRSPAPAPVVVVDGGFDSFIDEFVTLLGAMRDMGLDVIAFEGPGQGAMLVCCWAYPQAHPHPPLQTEVRSEARASPLSRRR